jgi:tape measure domain-containing protein
MATTLDTAIRINAKLDGSGLDQLKRGLQTLSQQSTVSKRTLDQLYTATKLLGAASGNTISSLKLQAQALGTLRDQAEFGSRKFRLLTKDIEAVESRLKRFQTTAEKSTGLSRGGALLAGAAGGVAGALAVQAADSARQGLQGIASVGINAETAQVRLKALADQFGEYNEAQASAVRIAATLRISQIEAADGFSKLYAALRPTGITLQEVEDAFIGFAAAARASGATAEESSAALLQLKQALGAGVLQGDELRSIREQAPAVGQAIAKEMGVTIGELKKLGSEGKITTDIVIRALAKLRGEKLGQLSAQFNTSAQAMKDLQVATEDFGTTIARVFGPTAVAAVRGLASAVREVNAVMGALTGDGGAQGRIQDMQRARSQAQQDTDRRPFGLFDAQGKQRFFQQRTQQVFQRLQQQRADAAVRAGGGGVNGSQQAARQAADAERAAARARAATALSASATKTTETAPQSNLNQLLIENLRLNTELGNVGKDRISQLNAEIELIPQILKLQLSVLNASVKGQDLQQSRINAITEARARSADLEQQLEGVNKEVAEIAEQATSLRVSTLSGLLPKESPLKEAIKQVKTELLEADKAAEDLLNRLSGLAGTNPASGAARAAIGNLRGDLATANPGEIASQRLVQGDVDALRQQVVELQNAGRELSTLDQLVLKYGDDWEQIDPKIRASLGALSEQKDKLEELNRVNERNKQLAEGVAGTIGGGLSSAMDLLIDGTEEWGNSLKEIASGVLKDIARQLVQTMVIAPIVKGITKGFGFADGGIMSPSGPVPLKTYSRGGIANTPQLALYGEGSMNEAYVPLPDGRRIPVALQGGRGSASTTNVVINVDASGTKASGDPGAGNALARDLANVVDARLLHHKRPGGLLAS